MTEAKNDEREGAMGTSNKQAIYIIGPRKLQNDILADYLEKEMEAKCTVSMDVHQGMPATNGCQALVLLDSPERDLDKFFMGLESASKRTLNEHIVALFNVKPGSGIEDKGHLMGDQGLFLRTGLAEADCEGYYIDVQGGDVVPEGCHGQVHPRQKRQQ